MLGFLFILWYLSLLLEAISHQNFGFNCTTSTNPPLELISINTPKANFRLENFQNSGFLSSFIIKYYRHSNVSVEISNPWLNPIVFAVVTDEKFLFQFEVMRETLASFDIMTNDIVVACLSMVCQSKLSSQGIQSIYYECPKECHRRKSDTLGSCHLSYAKYTFLTNLLENSLSVFFLDLDVYFKKSPLPQSILDPRTDIYAQFDTSGGDSHDELNFGCFLVQSNNVTRRSFRETGEFCLRKRVFDQRAFSDMIPYYKLKSQLFSQKQYYAFHFSPEANIHLNTSKDYEDLVLIHMTCVEGSQLKYLYAREFFGPFPTPSLYSPCQKTVTISYVDTYTSTQLLSLLKLAMSYCRYFNRKLRLLGWDYHQRGAYKSLFDLNKLHFEKGVELVESNYWENVQRFYPHYHVTAGVLPITEKTLLDPNNTISEHPVIGSSDDLSLLVLNSTLLDDSSGYGSYLCDAEETFRRRYKCARSCH
jgi:hypothetical protein